MPWSCLKCTLINKGDDKSCEMCSADRPEEDEMQAALLASQKNAEEDAAVIQAAIDANIEVMEAKQDQDAADLSYATSVERLITVIIKGERNMIRSIGGLLGDGCPINGVSFRHNKNGRTPLAYAVFKNDFKAVQYLLDSSANINQEMGPDTCLTVALTSERYDMTEMVRLLLSKGASTTALDAKVESGQLDPADFNVTMQYWLDMARSLKPVNEDTMEKYKAFDLVGMPELEFGCIGERIAVRIIYDAVLGFCMDPAADSKPLVLMACGPPGHGKTFFSRSIAKALVGEENLLEIACGNIQDNADLFGSRMGGGGLGGSSDGELTAFLRQRSGKRSVVFMDEFEKLAGLTNALGWGQSSKIYQALLEPWEEGTLTDRGSRQKHGEKIDIRRTIFICTSNICQKEIKEFSEQYQARFDKGFSDSEEELQWVQNELVKKKIAPVFKEFFRQLGNKGALEALFRRIDAVAPFIPFSKKELTVVADTETRKYLSRFRDPPKLDGPKEERRGVGNLIVHHSECVARYAATSYDVMAGATSLRKIAKECRNKVVKEDARQGFLDLRQRQDGVNKGKREVWFSVTRNSEDRSGLVIKLNKASPTKEQRQQEMELFDSIIASEEQKQPDVEGPQPPPGPGPAGSDGDLPDLGTGGAGAAGGRNPEEEDATVLNGFGVF